MPVFMQFGTVFGACNTTENIEQCYRPMKTLDLTSVLLSTFIKSTDVRMTLKIKTVRSGHPLKLRGRKMFAPWVTRMFSIPLIPPPPRTPKCTKYKVQEMHFKPPSPLCARTHFDLMFSRTIING